MKKRILIYGTWKQREYEETAALFRKHNVPYKESVHTRVFRLEDGSKEVWRFHQFKALVTPEEELLIRKERARRKKFRF